MPIRDTREYRNMKITRAQGKDGTMIVKGYATLFDQPYLLASGKGWQLWEVVDRGAFDSTDMSDVILQYDHQGHVYARNKNNTLSLKTDLKGLYVEAYLGGTEIGKELYEEIAGGYTDKMSFGFVVNGEYEDYQEDENGIEVYTRHITSIKKLYDVSAVSIPANDATEISARNITKQLIERIQAKRTEKEKLALRKRKLMMQMKLGCL